jgi:hypothetical protein
MPSGLWHYEFIAYLYRGSGQERQPAKALLFSRQECQQAEEFTRPSGRRLANFVRPRASLPRNTKNKPAHRCTPIIDNKKFFSRTPKCYLRWSWDRDPEDSKKDPMVQVRKRRANREPSLVVGKGHISWSMLGLIALTRQKHLP